MADISYYWQNKSLRALQANQHTEIMAHQHPEEIKDSLFNSLIYSPTDTFFVNPVDKEIPIFLAAKDSVSAIFDYYEGKTAVLNFASYKNPGGGFLSGSRAQEESLCHSSFLYNVLSKFPTYYGWNQNHLNRSLYENRAIYSPRILFENEDGDTIYCDVITCAAPNITPNRKYNLGVTDEENLAALDSRIHFVLDIAAENQVDTLILGAFGCGVFGQDAEDVCRIFVKYLTSSHRCFKKVIFAIPNDVHSENYDKFFKVLTEEKEKRNEKL